MAKFVPDVKTNRWVLIAPSRINRPHDNGEAKPAVIGQCVFCPGNELVNPIELFRVGGASGDANWKVRVIANKYPITDFHEVIIHSPDHDKDIDELPLEQVRLVLTTYRQRYNYHTSNDNGSVLIFNNHDVHAGASIHHPHSQVVVVPRQIGLDVIPKEPVINEVLKTTLFTVYCPDFSQWPYEIWLAPNVTGRTFGETTEGEIFELSTLLSKILALITKKFLAPGPLQQVDGEKEIPYNYYIYHGKDWYLRVIPRLINRAGFELGTGISVNIVDPTKAAEEYRLELGAVARG